jgi:hypothetical protein
LFHPRDVDFIRHRYAMDWRVTAFTIALAVVTGLLFGLAPAFHTARSDISNTLRAGTRGLTRGTARAPSVLV